MNMLNAIKKSLCILSLISMPLFAGTKDGGGGKGVLCGSTLRVLDLYESEVLNDVIPGPDMGNLQHNLDIYKDFFFDRSLPVDLMIKTLVLDRFKDIPAGETLEDIADVTVPKLPSECELVQIAIYKDKESVILRDRKLWDMLSSRDQAALVFHELLYLSHRIQGESTSDLTRWSVAINMSNMPLFSEMPNLSNIPKIWCATENYSWVMVDQKKSGKHGVGIYFKSYNNTFQTQPKVTFAPGFNLKIITEFGFAFMTDIHINGQTKKHVMKSTLEDKKIKMIMFPEGERQFGGYCTYVKPKKLTVPLMTNKNDYQCDEAYTAALNLFKFHNGNARIERDEAKEAFPEFDEDLKEILPPAPRSVRLKAFHFVLAHQRAPISSMDMVRMMAGPKKYSVNLEQAIKAMGLLYCQDQ